MNITADLIKSILTQAGEAITRENLRTECDDDDIIIRFEDGNDNTISIYYSHFVDILAIGTMSNTEQYRVRVHYRHASKKDLDILTKHIELAVVHLEIALELEG